MVLMLAPDQCFRICVHLRLTHCYRYCIPHHPLMSMNMDSERGLVSLLKWWQQSGLSLKYSDRAIKWASESGHVTVLEWWKQSGNMLKYSDIAMEFASYRGHVAVLEWWKQSGLAREY